MAGSDKLSQAIATVNRAIEADNAGDYEKALDIYKMALNEFVFVVKWEKNPKFKEMIRQKTAEYMERAEKLKSYLDGKKEGGSGASGGGGDGSKPALVGVNGAGKGTGGEDGDEESKKLRNALAGAILQERPNIRWEDVAGLEAAKETLKEAVVLPIKFPSLFQGKRQAWKGILLYGPPGTGKSYLAKAVATEANSTFFSISSADLVSKWMGESEKLIRALFVMARENKPSVIFIDEIDALCGTRSEGESDATRRIKTEMMVQMEGVGQDSKGVLVLGATNLPWQLDSAIRRRFQRRIHIGLPDAAGRAKMFSLALGDTKTTLQSQDYHTLSSLSEGYSGSDVANVVQEALYRPLRKIAQATHFKRVTVDGEEKLTPCSPGDIDAREMTYNDLPLDGLLPPDVEFKDLRQSLQGSHPTVSQSDVQKQVDWTNEFGSEGA